MALRRALGAAVIIAVVAAAVLYLRDPPWLLEMTTGLGPVHTDEDGRRFRWTDARASFFVQSDLDEVVLAVRDVRDSAEDWPLILTITIDDRVVERLRLGDESWRTLKLQMPPPSGRKVRRIDLKLDRLRRNRRGIQLAEPQLVRRRTPRETMNR